MLGKREVLESRFVDKSEKKLAKRKLEFFFFLINLKPDTYYIVIDESNPETRQKLSGVYGTVISYPSLNFDLKMLICAERRGALCMKMWKISSI
jgi:hypothetical protein